MSTPTIVIGIGQAGCRMLTSVHDVVSEEGDSGQFRFFTIDTNETDLNRDSPDAGNVTKIHLEKPMREWQSNRNEYFYLDEDYTIELEQGSGQSRPVSRYHIDSSENFGRLRDILRNGIDQFVDEQEISPDATAGADFHVWIMNSLGGGTGSGAFPFVAGIVQSITNQMDQQVFVNGIGSLPRLDNVWERDLDTPPGPNIHYANAYAALAEIRELINDRDDEEWEAPRIKVLSGETVSVNDYLEPSVGIDAEDRMFYKYWLIGFQEDEGGAYRERMNRIAANAIYYYANKSGIEDFPYTVQGDKEEPLAGITSAEVQVPIEDLRKYYALEGEIEELGNEIDRLADEIEYHRESRNYLDEVLDTELGLDGVPEGVKRIHGDILKECANAPNYMNPETDLSDYKVLDHAVDRDELREHLNELIESVMIAHGEKIRDPAELNGNGDLEFDKDDVVTYLYLSVMMSYLEEVLADHRFAELVNEVWESEDFKSEIREYAELQFNTADAADPDGKWETVLEEFIPDHGQALDEQRQSTIWPVKRYKLARKVNRLKELNRKLPDLYEQYKKIKVLHNVTENLRQTARKDLKDDRRAIEDVAIEEKLRTKREQERRKRSKEREREDMQQDLREGDRTLEGQYSPPMRNLDELNKSVLYPSISVGSLLDEYVVEEEELEAADTDQLNLDGPLQEASLTLPQLESLGLINDNNRDQLTPEMVTSRPTIDGFISKGFINREEVARLLSDLVASPGLTKDPVQDITMEMPDLEYSPSDPGTKKILGVMMNDANADLLNLELDDQQNFKERIADEEFEFIRDKVSIENGLSIRLVSWFLPIDLKNTSEYGVMHRTFTDDQRDVKTILQTITDEDVVDSFAYPELFDGTELETLPQHREMKQQPQD